MTTSAYAPPPLDLIGDDSPIARRTMRRVSMRLLPFILLLYILNYLDRTNVGLAALQMNRDLEFSPAAYSLGAGIFFLGYAVFEVPSNLFLARVGPRWWISRIMVTWGLIACAMMFVRTPMHFYLLRLSLGIAEAGFFPGIVYYMSQWFPVTMRARAQSRFMLGVPLANIIGGFVGGGLLSLDGRLGIAGWQWLFLLEGIPSVILGIVVLVVLTNTPADATWLAEEERGWLIGRLQRDEDSSRAPHGLPPLEALLNGTLWLTALALLLANTAAYANQFWGPTIIRDTLGTSNTNAGYIGAAMGIASALMMLVVSASSDRHQERFGHAAFSALMVCAGCVGVALLPLPLLRILSLALIPMGIASFLSPYFCLPGILFRGSALAAAIALVNSIGNLGGFFGPNVIGLLVTWTGSNTGAFLSLAVFALAAAAICMALKRQVSFGGRSA